MNILSAFPRKRMRRLRRDDFTRRLIREHSLTANDFIYPVFILDGEAHTEPVESMPGVERLTLDKLYPVAEECLKLGIPCLALFPVVEKHLKSPAAEEAFNPKGLVPRAITGLKQRFPELGVMTDVALMANLTSESATQISESCQQLLTTSQVLETSVSRFKVD